MLTLQEIIGLSVFCWVFVGHEKILFFLVFLLAFVRWLVYSAFGGPDPVIYTADIFKVADLCIEAGYFPGLEDRRYILLLRWLTGPSCEIHRKQVSCVLPLTCRVWLVKGTYRYLLGDSDALPADLSDGVSPPFTG